MMKHVLFAIVAILLTNITFSQESKYVVKLVKKSNPEKVRYIEEGRRIKIYTDKNTEYAGKLYIPTDSTLRVDAISLPVDQIPKIRGNSTGLLVTKITGGVLGAAGLAVFIMGSIILVNGLNPDVWAEIFLIPVGMVIAGTGAVATLVGGSVLFVNGKKYDLRDKWDMSIVPVSVSENSK